jgi:hypothetical protein
LLGFIGHTHTYTHTHLVGLLLMSDQLVAEAATYNKHKAPGSMTPPGFETMIPAIKRQQTYAPDHTATGIGV